MSFCHPHWQTRNPGQRYLTTAKSKELHDLLEPSLASLGYELVQVRLLSGGRPTLQVYAEPLSGAPMRMDDCSTVSRHVSAVLDVEDPIAGAYNLEVGSPGIDRPLTRTKDYADWVGHEARLTLAEPIDGQKQFKGELEGIDPEGVIAIRNRTGALAYVPFDQVIDAKLALTDKLIAATVPLSADGAEEEEIEEEDTH